MNEALLEKLAGSLTAEDTALVPFLPYLLQDLWELGASPQTVVDLIGRHVKAPETQHFLDLACGKGAVSVAIAKAFGAPVAGIDIVPEFIEFATYKAKEHRVASLCTFIVADANTVVRNSAYYDIVIFGAAGNVLGEPEETLKLLGNTVRENGFVIIDEGYLEDGHAEVRYQNYAYLTRQQWLECFGRAGLRLLEEVVSLPEACAAANGADLQKIEGRAQELSALYPQKKALFDDYVASQADEGHDLEAALTAVTWILQRT